MTGQKKKSPRWRIPNKLIVDQVIPFIIIFILFSTYMEIGASLYNVFFFFVLQLIQFSSASERVFPFKHFLGENPYADYVI